MAFGANEGLGQLVLQLNQGQGKRAEYEKRKQKIKAIYHNNDGTQAIEQCRSILEGVELTFQSILCINI